MALANVILKVGGVFGATTSLVVGTAVAAYHHHKTNNVYDAEGYNKKGYDKDGYDKNGYDKKGYDREGYDREGYDRGGYDKNGRDKNGDRYISFEEMLAKSLNNGDEIASKERCKTKLNKKELQKTLNDVKQDFEEANESLQTGYNQQVASKFRNIINKICDSYIGYDINKKEFKLNEKIKECQRNGYISKEEASKLHQARIICNDTVHETRNVSYNEIHFAMKVTQNFIKKYETFLGRLQ